MTLLPRSTFAFAPILANRSSRKRQAGRMPKTLITSSVQYKTVFTRDVAHETIINVEEYKESLQFRVNRRIWGPPFLVIPQIIQK